MVKMIVDDLIFEIVLSKVIITIFTLIALFIVNKIIISTPIKIISGK